MKMSSAVRLRLLSLSFFAAAAYSAVTIDTGTLQGSIDVLRLAPSSTISGVDFAGTFQGVNHSITYTVHIVSGSTATGIVTATNATADSC